MSDIFLFLDSEFTSFDNSELISIALAQNETDNLYIELNDYDKTKCSEFVLTDVLPLLSETQQYSSRECAQSIFDYLQTKSKEGTVYIVGDYAGDWELFLKLMRKINKQDKRALGIEGFINIYQYLNYTIQKNIRESEPAKTTLDNIEGLYDAHQKSWFTQHNKTEHHALSDALANRYAFTQAYQYIKTLAAGNSSMARMRHK